MSVPEEDEEGKVHRVCLQAAQSGQISLVLVA